MPVTKLEYHHVDVFTPRPFSGNSLAVFVDAGSLTTIQMLTITKELRHFESIFLISTDVKNTYKAFVFDLIEELDFAGHPLIGAACVLHSLSNSEKHAVWTLVLKSKTISVETERVEGGFRAVLDQGRPDFLGEVPRSRRAEFAAALNLEAGDLDEKLPLEIVSTGLRYLIIPINAGLEHARIVRPDFGSLLRTVGAQFAYVLDVEALEGRHWNNDGLLEDIATGSAAGTVGAFMVKHGRIAAEEEFILHQGRFVGRSSEIRVRSEGTPAEITRVQVGGEVALVGRGVLDVAPEAGE
jgi:trans-2,3-dihydro-3-hydroxyanthranilate isomerase